MEKEECWHPTKILFGIQVLLLKKGGDRIFSPLEFDVFRLLTKNLNPPSNAEPYYVFKRILEDFYPLGVRIEVITRVDIYEEEGVNKSEITFCEFKEFLIKKIKEKESKIWSNFLNQYVKLYGEDELSKIRFKIKVPNEVYNRVKEKIESYIDNFINDKVYIKGFNATFFSFRKQMEWIIEYINSRLEFGFSTSNFSINELDFIKWVINMKKIPIKSIFPPPFCPFCKAYGFLESLLALNLKKLIKINSIGFDIEGKFLFPIFYSTIDIIRSKFDLKTILKMYKIDFLSKSIKDFPKDLQWEEITIRFLNNNEVLISYRDENFQTNFEEMGFMDKRDKKPKKAWKFLKDLSETGGEITWKSKNASFQGKKHKQILKNLLQDYFRIKSDPFHQYKKESSYKIKIKLIPEASSENNQSENMDNANQEILDYFKEETQTISDYSDLQ
ncbi:MAG: hypothetical protein NC935_05715 [Candidatus Omnitrophica bacterium]|nr:hypothetical protein [Candidatus Omnitrophota bacterium]